MTAARDPLRLRDPRSSTDPALQRALGTAQRGAASAARLHALEAAILQRAAAEGGGAGRSARRWSTAWKVLIILSLGGGSALWYAMQPPEPQGRRDADSSSHFAAAVEPQAQPAPRPSVNVEESAAIDEARRPSVESSDERAVRRSEEPRVARKLRAHVADAALAPVPRARAARAKSESVHERAAVTSTSAPGEHHEARAPNQTDVPPELELLAQAQRALRDSPRRAVELANEHRRDYPAGAFIEEREAIAVEGLSAAGDAAAARARGLAFLQRHPRSTYAARVATLIRAEP